MYIYIYIYMNNKNNNKMTQIYNFDSSIVFTYIFFTTIKIQMPIFL
jgi:hypothetical protein